MGLIKSIQTSIAGQHDDMFRNVIKSGGFEEGVIIKRVTSDNGLIVDQSRVFIEPGECGIFIDNGAIKDIVTEPGMYFMDSSSPTLFQTDIFRGIGATVLQAAKRIAYEGEEITKQFVIYINLAEQVGLKFGTPKPILYKDPEWGPIEVSIMGQYAIKVSNPVNLLTEVLGNRNELRLYDLEEVVRPYIVAEISTEIANSGLSFDEISTKQNEIGLKAIENVTEKLDNLGVALTKVVVSGVDVPDEIKESMRNRTGIKMKASSVNAEEANVYEQLNRAEAMKDLANNSNSAGATVMGLNMGNMFGGQINSNNNPNPTEPKE